MALAAVISGPIVASRILCNFEEDERRFAVCTKEWLALALIHILIAFLLFSAINPSRSANISVISFAGMVLGYPLLLNSKILSVNGIPIGPEYMLQQMERNLLPGIKYSIIKRYCKIADAWQKTDLECLHRFSSNYLMALEDGKKHLKFVDNLLNEAKEKPTSKACIMENSKTLYYKMKELGGLRALEWIIKNCGLHP